MSDYMYSKMAEMEHILQLLSMPAKLQNKRTILVLLAIAKLPEKASWRHVNESYSRVHDVINFINEHYPDKGGTDPKGGGYKENSRETIRDDSIAPLCQLAILEHNGEKSQSGKSGYRLTNSFAVLLKSFRTDLWEEELKQFIATFQTYQKKFSQMKSLKKGLSVTFKGQTFVLESSSHNLLQKDILDTLVPYFMPDSKLLYIGDTKKRQVIYDEELLSKLKVDVLNRDMLPDIILYNEMHNWIVFIEAYTTVGEFTIERVQKIKEYCRDVPQGIELIFLTAFKTMKKCQGKLLSIAWDTEIWVAEEPTHMIHKNGDKFIGGHTNQKLSIQTLHE